MMNRNYDVKLVEVKKSGAYPSELRSKYSTSQYYDVSVRGGVGFWKIDLSLKPLGKMLERDYRGRLFEDHVEEPRVFAAVQGNKQVGCIELGYDRWNNRMRVWEFLVEEGFRRKGIGTLLMRHAVKIAREKGARMLVLETQTNVGPALDFYLAFGFQLVGLDTAAYSNDDIGKKEVRLELGLKL
jgi:ribosomal protein S18 acetylase RimI-like enzyme